jgi:uncharacterized protein YoaH (UPF0181 family)
MLEKHRNPDGTYNGVSAMSEMSGLSQEEIQWTWERAKELRAMGLSKEQVARALRMEARDKFGKK